MNLIICEYCLRGFLRKLCKNKISMRLYFILLIAVLLVCAVSMTKLYWHHVTEDKKLEYKRAFPQMKIQPIINAAGIKPKHKKTNPELNIYPIVNPASKTVLIWYDEKDISSIDNWINLIDNFVNDYKPESLPPNAAPFCDFKNPPKLGQVCPVDIDRFGPCSPPYYGYYGVSPCVFLQLKQAHGWLPDYYNNSKGLPAGMPSDLIAEIENASTRHESNQVWVSCEGEFSADKEHVEAFNYYPSQGFPSYYFPYRYRITERLNPIIAVEIVDPTPGVIIGIECRLWAKNVDYKSGAPRERIGSVHFAIMRDEWNDEWDSREVEHQNEI